MKMRELPPDFGPMRVCQRLNSKRERLNLKLSSLACCVAVMLYAFWRGLDWHWSIGAPAVAFIWSLFYNADITLRAGDGWFATNTRFVRTDRLAQLRARAGVPLRRIELRDSDGRVVRALLRDLTRYPEVWQLIAAGIEQSLARSLVIDDKYTAITLRLPYTSRRKRAQKHASIGQTTSSEPGSP